MRRLAAIIVVVVLGTTAALLYEINGNDPPTYPVTFVAFHVAAFLVTGGFAVWISGELGLPSLLLVEQRTDVSPWRRLVVYGGLMGLAMAAANVVLFRITDGNPLLPRWLQGSMESVGDAAILSARAAFLEETLFRLFAIPFLVSVAMRLRTGWRPRFGFETGPASSQSRARPPASIIVAAVVVSALLFALRHPFNPLRAGLSGLVLGWIYLRGGWESAVLSHFLANFLVFTVLYL